MSDEVVSVIMPVYNGAKYIEKSIDSVFQQTYSAIELITINDGSLDSSEKLLWELAAATPENVNMKVVSQENTGICEARNRALDATTGKYIAFIDQDDFMKSDCLETLVNALEKEKADVTIGGFELVDAYGDVLERWQLNPEEEWSKYRISAPWGRIFRKRILDEHHLRFMQTKISEDLYFNFLFFSFAKKITIVPYVGYQWLYNEQSESHSNMSRAAADRNPLIMMTKLMQDMKWPNTLNPVYFEYFMMKHIIWYLFYVVKSTEKEQLGVIYNQCFDWLQEKFPDYKKNPLLHLRTPKGEQFKIRLIIKMAMVLKRVHLLMPVLKLYRIL